MRGQWSSDEGRQQTNTPPPLVDPGIVTLRGSTALQTAALHGIDYPPLYATRRARQGSSLMVQATPGRWEPDVLLPGSVGMQGSMVW